MLGRLPSCCFVLLLCLFNQLAFAQDWRWAQKGGGPEWDMGQDIVVDAAGNSYVTGSFYRTASFGATSLVSSPDAENFLAKYDVNGELVWAQKISGGRFDPGQHIALDRAGNIYLAGTLGRVSKYAPNGKMVWAKRIAENAALRDIAVDPAGAIYLTGQFISTATFGATLLYCNKENSFDRFTVFLAKLDTNGNNVWARKVDGNNHDYGVAIALDAAANIFVAGQFIGKVTIGQESLNSHDYSSFIARYDPSGKPVWAKQLNFEATGLALDVVGNSYLTGNFFGSSKLGPGTLISKGFRDVVILKLNLAGEVVWARSAGGNNDDECFGIAVDRAGNCFITGIFYDTATFDQFSLSGDTSYYNLFVAKYNPDGKLRWASQALGPYYEVGSAISTDAKGNAYITGRFYEPTTFGAKTLTSGGQFDVFVGKIGAEEMRQTNVRITALEATGACEEEALKVFFQTEGNFNSDNIFIVELSDSTSSFAAPVQISHGPASPLLVKVPADFTTKPGYRIRVIASSPVTIVDDKGLSLFQRERNTKVLFPNIITPNNDGLNDVLVFPIPCQKMHLKVFNRLGRPVYEQANYQNNWDGGNLAAGTYYYHLRMENGQTWKGWVEMSR